jgi:hypothetical protein
MEEIGMTKARRIGLMVLLLSSGFSAFFAIILQRTAHEGIVDFRIVYLASRCLIEHRDPYSETEFLHVFQEDGGTVPSDPVERHKFQDAAMAVVYLPTALLLLAPFAALGWGTAQVLWTILTIGLFTFACCLVWSVAADSSPPVATCLLAFMLANAEVVFAFGNAAGVAVSLCAIAVWCFITGRFALAGVICLAASLAIKPHDSAAVWLYLLIVGGTYRKRALQVLIIVCGLGVLAVVWTYQVAPHWVQEMRSNLELVSARGGVADPGPSGTSNGTGGMIISLQSVASVFGNHPRFYNPVSWIICAPLFIAWLMRTLRAGTSHVQMWLALAALVPLSMLPVYHRPYDAKLLLLAVPACAAIWAQGGARRWLALVTTSAAILVTSDLPSTFLTSLSRQLPTYPVGLSNQILAVVLTRPAPLVLLAMSIFYVWVYVRQPSPPSVAIDGRAS